MRRRHANSNELRKIGRTIRLARPFVNAGKRFELRERDPCVDGASRVRVVSQIAVKGIGSPTNSGRWICSCLIGPAQKMAHTIMSFGFEGGEYLAWSIEVRRLKSGEYSPIADLFKNDPLVIMAADERDVVRLRTNIRHEDVELYRLRASPEMARTLLLEYVADANGLVDTPQFYNSLTTNCTTTIVKMLRVASSLTLAIIAAALILSPAFAAEPYGKWVRPSNRAQVDFYNCDRKLCGKVADKGASSAKVGTVIVSGAAKTGANEWKGSLLNPDDGKTYKGVITLVGADGLNLKGCALGVFCQGETWRRVK
jgi:uncharacterized protein (DUF2147 family)